jgi:hypothetical protein
MGRARPLESASRSLNGFGDNDNHNLVGLMLSMRCVQELKEKVFEYDQRPPICFGGAQAQFF